VRIPALLSRCGRARSTSSIRTDSSVMSPSRIEVIIEVLKRPRVNDWRDPQKIAGPLTVLHDSSSELLRCGRKSLNPHAIVEH
jgi:hypothetical protein